MTRTNRERVQAAARAPRLRARRLALGFTLLEVMIALMFIGIAMLALLSLHRTDLESVIRGQNLTRAAMLAQQLMSTAEADRFPLPGVTRGDFNHEYPGQYPHFRWEREVTTIAQFPDIRRVRVTVLYGANLSRHFDLVEFMHNPTPPQNPGANPAEDSGQAAADDDAVQ